jgi:hypothetical protein
MDPVEQVAAVAGRFLLAGCVLVSDDKNKRDRYSQLEAPDGILRETQVCYGPGHLSVVGESRSEYSNHGEVDRLIDMRWFLSL